MPKLIETHGFQFAGPDNTAVLVDATIEYENGLTEREEYVYRQGDVAEIAIAISQILAEENIEIAPAAPAAEEEAPPLFPLTPRQLRLALSRNDYLALVKPALEAIEDQRAREEALIEWGYAARYDPGNPLIEQLRLALGITEGEMDTMWRTAQTL